MAFLKIPVSDTLPWYSFTITLSGKTFTLQLRYNVRMQRWLLSILDAINTPILMGVPVLIVRDLNGQYATLAVPEGTLFCLDNTGNDTQPTLPSFSLTHSIYYDDTPR